MPTTAPYNTECNLEFLRPFPYNTVERLPDDLVTPESEVHVFEKGADYSMDGYYGTRAWVTNDFTETKGYHLSVDAYDFDQDGTIDLLGLTKSEEAPHVKSSSDVSDYQKSNPTTWLVLDEKTWYNDTLFGYGIHPAGLANAHSLCNNATDMRSLVAGQKEVGGKLDYDTDFGRVVKELETVVNTALAQSQASLAYFAQADFDEDRVGLVEDPFRASAEVRHAKLDDNSTRDVKATSHCKHQMKYPDVFTHHAEARVSTSFTLIAEPTVEGLEGYDRPAEKVHVTFYNPHKTKQPDAVAFAAKMEEHCVLPEAEEEAVEAPVQAEEKPKTTAAVYTPTTLGNDVMAAATLMCSAE